MTPAVKALFRGVAAILALAALSTPARAQLGLGMAPMRVELRLSPGEEYSGSLKISSGSSAPLRVRGEALDFTIDGTATPQFERNIPQEAGVSCKDWLQLNPTESEIDRSGALAVRYTLRVPAQTAAGSYACAAGFTTLPSIGNDGSSIGMRMAVRVVASIYVQVGSPIADGQLKGISVERLSHQDERNPESWQAVVVIENPSVMYFRPTGSLDVLDSNGTLVESIAFTPLPVLRQRDQRFLFPLKTPLSSGHYTLRTRVDLGTGDIQQAVAEVLPPSAGDLAAADASSPVDSAGRQQQ
jgi:hypothetical protein